MPENVPQLSERQTRILKHLIDEYIETAAPVGSVTLDKKYNLGVSPATLRNEMVQLTKLGYLSQPHTSAGRTPSPMGLKFYINNLMQAKDLSVTDEVSIKEKVWDYRKELQMALREATKELANRTKALAVSADNSGDVFYSGTANILDFPEFYEIDLTRNVLALMDHFDSLEKIFALGGAEEGIHILLGDDFGMANLSSCGMIFTRFGEGKKYQGTIGVLGPYRFNYSRIVPTVRYFGDLIEELAGE